MVLGGVPESLELFRGPLLQMFVESGHEVIALAGYESPAFTKKIERRGAKFGTYRLARTSLSPLHDLATVWSLWRWCKRESPDLVLAYTAKPVIWGGIACQLGNVASFHAMVTGLGSQLPANNVAVGWGTSVKKWLITKLYAIALRRANSVIFQNADDREFFVTKRIVGVGKTRLVAGSGVDLSQYHVSMPPDEPIIFLCIARLLIAKGLREYAAAAKLMKSRFPHARFQLVGMEEQGAAAVPLQEVQQWHDDGIVEFLGRVDHSASALAGCHVFVLPSFYGEGLPRTLLEAMAVGRPVITTDNVGCREPVVDGVTGLLVESRSVQALFDAMTRLIDSPTIRESMGIEARKLAEDRFDVNKVNKTLAAILNLRLSSSDSSRILSDKSDVI